MKLFGFGTKSENHKPKVLGPKLTELFGGVEGAEMIVESSESGLAAIDAAESRLEEWNTAANELQVEKDAAVEMLAATEATLQEEQQAHAATQAAFATFKAESGEKHTKVDKAEDAFQGDHKAGEMSQIRKDEAAAKAQGAKIYNKIKKD